MPRTRDQQRVYQAEWRKRKAAEAAAAAKNGEPAPLTIVPAIVSPPKAKPAPVPAPKVARRDGEVLDAVRQQLDLLPADVLARIPVEAARMRVLARVCDDDERPHLHTAATRELGLIYDKLAAMAPAAVKSRLQLQREDRARRAAGA